MNPVGNPTIAAYGDIAVNALIDVLGIAIFVGAVYFRRHRRKDLAVVFAFFNICLFVTITVIQMTEVAAGLGFGLFAILSIIRLRSEPFSNREIGYFFGALVIALVNGVGTADVWFCIGVNAAVVAAMFLLDHPRVMKAAFRCEVTLDSIHTDRNTLIGVVSSRLNLDVIEVTVLAVDYIRDCMKLDVQYHERPASSVRPSYTTGMLVSR